MKGTHELGEQTSRRAALGLVGGFATLAIGAAPSMHERADLDVDVGVLEVGFVADGDGADRVDVELANHTGDELVPEWFTWDKRRKTRHNWEIENGPVPIEAGERARYELVATGKDAWMNAGVPVQLTVFERGEQRWKSIQFVPEGIDR